MFPQWKTLDSETVDNLLLIFAADSLNSSHPVSVPIGNPTEIDQIFDVVSYRKGMKSHTHLNNMRLINAECKQF